MTKQTTIVVIGALRVNHSSREEESSWKYFSYFSMQKKFEGTPLKSINKALLMSNHNIDKISLIFVRKEWLICSNVQCYARETMAHR